MSNYKLVGTKGKSASNRAAASSAAASRAGPARASAGRTAASGAGAARQTASSAAANREAAAKREAASSAAAKREAAARAEAPREPARAPAAKKKKKRMTGGKVAAIVVAVLVVAAAALVIYLGYYVKGLDTVFPNVWADGVSLSGMTFEEAKQALVDMGYESNADGVSATIVFPDGSSFTVFGNEAGLSLNAEEAAKVAFEYGKGGTFFGDGLSFVRSYRNRTDLNDVSIATFDEEYVRAAAEEHTKAYNDKLIADAVEITALRIVIVKGISYAPADEEAVHALAVETLLRAMAEKAELTVEYNPKSTVVKEIDLDVLYDSIYIEPVSSVYDPETFAATESSYGRAFDMASAKAMLDKAGMGEKVVIPLLTIRPEVNAEDINELLFRDVIAESSTVIGGNSNRVNNVELSSSLIDGTQLNPGDVFSFNDTVGERTSARGFLEAGAYVSNLLVTEIGGGICQTSSTIYYTVLKADLKVVERQPHQMTVGYLPLGGDATVNWGTIDFKFMNSTDYPIRIEIEIENRDLTVRLIGTKLDDNYIKLENRIISTTPYEVIEEEDEEIPPGKTEVYSDGATGFVVDMYKYFYDADDNLIDTVLVGRSVYSVQHRIIKVPPPQEEEEEEEPEEPEEPAEPEKPGETEGPEEPGETEGPEEPGETEGPAETEGPEEPGETEGPAETEGPEEGAEPVETEAPAQVEEVPAE